MALDVMLPFKCVVTVRAPGEAKQMISLCWALVKYLIGNREGKSSNRKKQRNLEFVCNCVVCFVGTCRLKATSKYWIRGPFIHSVILASPHLQLRKLGSQYSNTLALISLKWQNRLNLLHQRSVNFSCKGPDSNYFRFWESCGIYHNNSTLQL